MKKRKPAIAKETILLTIKTKTLDILGRIAGVREESRNKTINVVIETALREHDFGVTKEIQNGKE